MATERAQTNESNITLLFETFNNYIENIKDTNEWKIEADNTLSGNGVKKYLEKIAKTGFDENRMLFFSEHIPFEPQNGQFKSLDEEKLVYWNSFIFLIRRTVDSKSRDKGLSKKNNSTTLQYRYSEVSSPFISKEAYICRGHNKIDGIDETLGFNYTI